MPNQKDDKIFEAMAESGAQLPIWAIPLFALFCGGLAYGVIWFAADQLSGSLIEVPATLPRNLAIAAFALSFIAALTGWIRGRRQRKKTEERA
ncbi:MAG: hypothetical protein ACPGJU_08740 [Coraliomargarita sp.]